MSDLLSQHSLFSDKVFVATKEDLLQEKIEKYGDKIIVNINLERITVQKQPRQTFEEQKISELADDIEQKGLIHPITVMQDPENKEQFLLLIGGNRYLAYKHLNKKTIPCIVKNYSDNSIENELLQLAENMHRTDLPPIELADSIMQIKKKSGYTLDQLSKKIGRTIDSLKQYSRISKLSQEEKEYHQKVKSSKNDILQYLAKKGTKKENETEENTDLLFQNQALNQYHHLSKRELIEKIREAEMFLKIAKKLLKEKR